MMECSQRLQDYFDVLEKECKLAHRLASKARSKNLDPKDFVEVRLAKNMAERVVGIISVVAPQIVGSGAEKRIVELEQKYGAQDWRVAFKIAEDVAQEKFCKFKDKKEAMEIGIRTGFTYATVGVVSSPLEGLTSLEIKQRRDGKGEYFCLNYAGPIRNAGGTAASVSVLIADYVRTRFGYSTYDPDDKEKKRTHAELEDYHEFVTNLQYFPSKMESEFLMEHLPVEISGDPSEKYKVSNIHLQDLPRVPANLLRSGFCLIHSSCIPLKAPKLWKQLSKWGADFGMGHWSFLEEFLSIQKKVKAGKAAKDDGGKVKPDFTYIKDLVAGRPVFGHPLANGAFRLRYGRTRTSGFSAQAIHPATMIVLDEFLATATQLKVERPGKAAAFSPCDTIEGPVVKLKDGSVVLLSDEKEARRINKQVEEIIYLGDVLINYGDFFDRAHNLLPPGYCEEWWAEELGVAWEESKSKVGGASDKEMIAEVDVKAWLQNPLVNKPSLQQSLVLCRSFNIPLHPSYTYRWTTLSIDQFKALIKTLEGAKLEDDRAILSSFSDDAKRALELAAVPHDLINKEHVVIKQDTAKALLVQFGIGESSPFSECSEHFKSMLDDFASFDGGILDFLIKQSGLLLRDKNGIFIGGRMGRPEKAKMRKMVGSPHVLFPVGSEGGRLRSFQSSLDKGTVTSDFPLFLCPECKKQTIYRACPECKCKTDKAYFCTTCGVVTDCPHDTKQGYKRMEFDIRSEFKRLLKILKTRIFPDLIKGVKGTTNKEHTFEHLMKGIVRAKHDVYVNKDGTTRYDCSELTLTHFKPKEVNVGLEKLKSLGYTHDIKGKPLVDDNQVLELFPQDVVLPCCTTTPDERADDVLFNVANAVDELMHRHYKIRPYYNLKSKEDLAGHLIVGLAPHTSAGIMGRIVGFSNTQAFFAHPYYHAAMRRDCDGDESCIFLLMDAFLNFSKEYLPSSRGSTMDAPLVLTYILNPGEVDDMAFNMDIAWSYPLDFYNACLEYKKPWDVDIKRISHVLGTEGQFEAMGYTHETDDFNNGVVCSSYKTLPSMKDKLAGQMVLAEKIRAVDAKDVARLVIEKHFIRDIRGNLRKFSQQQFRCVKCNDKFRRPPLAGVCPCGGKILFTISQGSIIKYLEPSLSLAEKFNVQPYLKQSLDLTKMRIQAVFGRDKERQEGLGRWFG